MLGSGLLLPLSAQATVISNNNGNVLAAQYYTNQAYSEIKASSGGSIVVDGGSISNDDTPLGAVSEAGSLQDSGTTVTYNTSASISGFAKAHTQASMNITNTSGSHGGYNAVASTGFRTQALFESGTTPGQAVFYFHVSGTESEPYGTALGRLDFLARPFVSGNGSFFDVFGIDAIHELGAGDYTFTYRGSFANPLDILFYAAAGVFIGVNDPNMLSMPAPGTNLMVSSNYSNTFDLMAIDLFTTAGESINEWTMRDLASNQIVFNQNGRVAANNVPEPGTLILFGIGFAGLGMARRQRMSRS